MHGNLILGKHLKITHFLIWVAVVYYLWLARNKVVFQEGVLDCNSFISQIKMFLGDDLLVHLVGNLIYCILIGVIVH